jgi:REP element-mobilizing transposase RayT
MSRPLRLELAGGLYHVTSRGDRREDIYFNDGDRLAWLETLSQVCTRFNWRCHAWCQMTNHYHVVVETAEGNLSLGMRQLNGVYTQWINRTHKRVGHVFQGRYKAILVEKDSYLLELARYVVLNPVRARMVKAPEAWRWSCYHAMIGAGDAPPWLETDWILAQFSPQRGRAIAGYIDFVRAGVGLPSVWEQLRGQVFLGSDAFLARMQKLSDKAAIGEIPRVQRRPLAKPLSHYRDRYTDASTGMAAAYATGDYSMQEIAACFGVHYATVSRAVKLHEDKA